MESFVQAMQCWVTVLMLMGDPGLTVAAPETGSVEQPELVDLQSSEGGLRGTTGKPWLDDYAYYVNGRPRTPTVVGQSRQVALSHGEASAAARLDAARQLYDRFAGRLRPGLRNPDDRAWITADVAAQLAGGRYVIDSYASRTRRNYGEVWRHAILVDASERRLVALADRYNDRAAARRADVGRTFASVAALVGLIVLTYAGVNAWTRGYIRGRLRAAAVALGAAVLMWSGNLAG